MYFGKCLDADLALTSILCKMAGSKSPSAEEKLARAVCAKKCGNQNLYIYQSTHEPHRPHIFSWNIWNGITETIETYIMKKQNVLNYITFFS